VHRQTLPSTDTLFLKASRLTSPSPYSPFLSQIETAPHDPRFATINQARYCFVAYNEAHKCFKEKSEEDSECRKLAKKYRSICPMEWLEAWNEARENGTWMGKY